jgi:hypothetical protein
VKLKPLLLLPLLLLVLLLPMAAMAAKLDCRRG